MDNKDNELFSGIIDVPTEPQMPEQNTNNNQNLEYNFNFETQVETPQVNQQSQTQEMFSMPQVETPQPVQNNIMPQNEVLGMESVNPVQNNNVETITMPTETLEPQLTDEEKRALNEEKLKSLTADTNELVNPNLIVNPSLKPIGMQTQTTTQENNVQEEKGGKGKYVFAILIIGLIVLFIAFLPKLTEIFGF